SYGMTETASQIATASLQSLQQNEFPDIHLLSHAQARTTEDGHLQVQASSLLTCYAQNFPEGPHHWDPKVNGWFTSEDRGEVRRNILKILGRSGDYIKIGGEGSNVAKLRGVLEQTLLEIHPHEISQVCLLDVASERLGSEIHLVVSQLSAHIAEKIANSYGEKVLPYEKIRKIHFVEEIPRTALGKIQWSALRSRLC
ncbi:MAG TPA: hypothetical protein VN132_02455, partial [Bdellovibrio sp.]|nr:hypothetical protein [Bdellovibrio sp.]